MLNNLWLSNSALSVICLKAIWYNSCVNRPIFLSSSKEFQKSSLIANSVLIPFKRTPAVSTSSEKYLFNDIKNNPKNGDLINSVLHAFSSVISIIYLTKY